MPVKVERLTMSDRRAVSVGSGDKLHLTAPLRPPWAARSHRRSRSRSRSRRTRRTSAASPSPTAPRSCGLRGGGNSTSQRTAAATRVQIVGAISAETCSSRPLLVNCNRRSGGAASRAVPGALPGTARPSEQCNCRRNNCRHEGALLTRQTCTPNVVFLPPPR